MKAVKLIDLPKIVDPRGNLTVTEQMKNVPFDISRVYWTYDGCTPLQENRAFYKNVLKNTAGQTSFRYQTNDYAIALWMEYIRKREGWQEVPDEISFYFRFYMRALSEAINDWFLGGEKMSVEELAARIDAAMPEPLKPYLRKR